MKENESAIFLLDLKIESYGFTIKACLEYLVDKKPKGENLIRVQEQRILYTKFRDELIDMRDALK